MSHTVKTRKSSAKVTAAKTPPRKYRDETLPDYRPRTPLGRRLWELRKRIVASGQPLLSWEDLDREVAARRGRTTCRLTVHSIHRP
jgi:hypothetical protein